MVKRGPPDSVFDGLDLSRRTDRVLALKRLTEALEKTETMLIASANDAGNEPPSAKQCACSWFSIATISAGVRAVARVMIAEHKT